MVRGKTKLELVTDQKQLKATFKKRREGVFKKAFQLETLCDIVTCVIVYGPEIDGKPSEISTHPADQDMVRTAIRMYKEKLEHNRKTLDFCNAYLKKDKKGPGAGAAAGGGGGGGGKEKTTMMGGAMQRKLAIPVERARSYLTWVDAKIKAVEEKIGLLKAMTVNNEHRSMMFDMSLDHNFGYVSVQDWIYQPKPYDERVAQFDQSISVNAQQTLCANNNPMYTPSDQAQVQSLGLNPDNFYNQNQAQMQNVYQCENNMVLNQDMQMAFYDSFMLGLEQNSTILMNLNDGEYDQQQQYGHDTMQGFNAAQPFSCDEMLVPMQGKEQWSSCGASSNYSSSASCEQFSCIPYDEQNMNFEPLLEYFLNTGEFADQVQPQGGGAEPEAAFGSAPYYGVSEFLSF